MWTSNGVYTGLDDDNMKRIVIRNWEVCNDVWLGAHEKAKERKVEDESKNLTFKITSSLEMWSSIRIGLSLNFSPFDLESIAD